MSLLGKSLWVVSACWLCAALLPTPGHAQADPYAVQPGDALRVSVWKEESLEQDVLIRPDGRFSFPLVGEVDANGRSVEQLSLELTERLHKYIPDPVVTVSLVQIQGNKIYVVGKVNQPGVFILNSVVDVMQALSMAGGTTPFASLNKIKILRRVNGEQRAIPFRYGDVEKGLNLGQNIILQSGDVLVVP